MVDVYETKKKFYSLKATVKRYPEIKTKVKVATNLDSWGPTQKDMHEICEACHNYEDKRLIMRALWKRISTSNTKEWLHIHKALAIFEYLLIHGPESIVEEIKEQSYALKSLHEFQAPDDRGNDHGASIREKSRKIIEYVTKSSVLEEERNKANKLKERFSAISSDKPSAAASGSYSSTTINRPAASAYDVVESGPSFRSGGTTTPPLDSTPAPTGGAGGNPPVRARRTSGSGGAAGRSYTDTQLDPAYVDIEGLGLDEETIRQQQAILESFEKAKGHSPGGTPQQGDDDFFSPSPTPPPQQQQRPQPAQQKQAPKVAQPEFDLFGDNSAAPPPPQQQSLDSFFGASADDDIFSSAPAPQQQQRPQKQQNDTEDLFSQFPKQSQQHQQQSQQQSKPNQQNVDLFSNNDLFSQKPPNNNNQTDLFASQQQKNNNEDDLFASSAFSSNNNNQTQQQQQDGSGGGGSIWDNMDSNLCNLANLSLKPQQQQSPARTGIAPSLADLKKQHQPPSKQPAQPGNQQSNFFSNQGNDFNPFA